jgi:chromosome segregation ATPase
MDSINLALSDKIEGTNTNIAELKADIDSRFNTMKSDQDDINERLGKFQRETSRTLTDLQSAITRMSREFSDLEKRVKTLETPPHQLKNNCSAISEVISSRGYSELYFIKI